MNIMDNFPEMKGFYIVMDSTPIHVPSAADPSIIKWGYVPVYLPPHCPKLNPIEQFWSIIKSKVKRHPLKDTESLTFRRRFEGMDWANTQYGICMTMIDTKHSRCKNQLPVNRSQNKTFKSSIFDFGSHRQILYY